MDLFYSQPYDDITHEHLCPVCRKWDADSNLIIGHLDAFVHATCCSDGLWACDSADCPHQTLKAAELSAVTTPLGI